MFKLIATAPIHSISPVYQVPNSNLTKRELVLVETYTRDGVDYSNFISIEFLGDRVSLLDNYQPGHRVQVEAMIKGRETRDGRIFNSITGLSIVPFQQSANGTRPAPMPANPQPSYPQQGTYTQQGSAPYGQGANGYQQQNYQQARYQQALEASRQQYGSQPQGPGAADLPFPG